MRICYDVSQTGKLKAGCGYFAHGLLSALERIDAQNEYLLCPAVGDLFWDPDCEKATFRSVKPNFRRLPAPESFAESARFWTQPPADLAQRLGNPDILHLNNFFCSSAIRGARIVYTLYDLSFLVHPEWTTEANRVGCFSGVFNASLYADCIVSISESSRRHFLETFPHYPAERIGIVYPGSRFEGRAQSVRPPRFERFMPERFWLSVGTIEPRKNHRRLLEAYRLARGEPAAAMPLVLAGGSGWLMESFEKDLRDMGLEKDVVLTGYVEDAELQWLYANCFGFVYPSLFEGFGMPVLEAMGQGAAVICAGVTSLPEITGGAALMVNTSDGDAIAAAMIGLAAGMHDRDRLKSSATVRAGEFSWERSARRMMDYYAAVAEAPLYRAVGLADRVSA
jgi:glycosyltransferase involved in cell wall biosynthesis